LRHSQQPPWNKFPGLYAKSDKSDWVKLLVRFQRTLYMSLEIYFKARFGAN